MVHPVLTEESRVRPLRLSLCVLVWFVLAVLATRIALSDGLIYNHDWSWPYAPNQLWSSLLLNIGAWNPDGVGQPNLRPILHPIYLLWPIGVATHLPRLTLVLFLCLEFTAYAAGIYWTLRRLTQANGFVALIVASAGELGVPQLNQFAAGHFNALVAIATFPWLLGLLLDKKRNISKVLVPAALLVAFSVAQLQIFFTEIVLLGVTIAIRRPLAPGTAVLAITTSVSLAAPLAIVAISPGVANFAIPNATANQWLASNSAPFPQALIQLGYAPGYAETSLRAVPWFPASQLLWLPLLLAFLGAIWRRCAALAAVFAIATLLVLGANGPLGSWLMGIFSHNLYANVFRELYDFAAIAWTAEILLAGVCLASLPPRVAAPIGALLLAASASFWFTADLGGRLGFARPTDVFIKELQAIGGQEGDWRFLLSPVESPIGPVGGDAAGVDPSSYPVGDHPSGGEYAPSGPVEIAAGFLREGNQVSAQSWLRLLGVGKVLPEPGLQAYPSRRLPPLPAIPKSLRSRFEPIRPSQRRVSITSTCMLCAYPDIQHISDITRFPASGDFVSSSTERCHFSKDSDGFDPSDGWVQASAWEWLDPEIALLTLADPEALVTWSPRRLALPSCARGETLVIYAARTMRGGPRARKSTGTRFIRIKRPRFAWLGPTLGLTAVGIVPLKNGGFTNESSETALRYSWVRESGEGTIPAGTQWLVLRQSFSNGWHVRLDRGRVLGHLEADGYANAWHLKVQYPTRVQVWYEPQGALVLVQVLGALLWLIVFLGCVVRAGIALAPRRRFEVKG